MQRPTPVLRLIAFYVLCFVTLSCASSSVELNSERIARKFGSYGFEVLENTNNIRVSNLYSREASAATCRTFAVVGISQDIDPAFAAEHSQILQGGSIGAVFKRAGWRIDKRHQYIGEMKIGKQATRISRLMRLKTPASLAVHIYLLTIAKQGDSFDYAMIAEVHHPEYLTVGTLSVIYGGVYSGDRNREDAHQILELVREKFRDTMHSG
jgi:hypothetical protein